MIIALQLLGGFLLLLVGAEVLVRGAALLAQAMGFTQLVIGLTVVAFGTSSPEFAVSLQSALAGKADLAVGNAVGSNILNTLLILGISAAVIPLLVRRSLMRVDVPLMIAATLAVWLMSMDLMLSRIEGILLAGALAGYLCWLVYSSRRGPAPPVEVPAVLSTAAADSPASGFRQVVINLGLVAVGLVLLGVGCRLFVVGSVETARLLGVSELVIGLTIVSLGTSLPELVTCLVAAVRGHQDIVVGNVVGSNLFNILGVLGVTAIVAPSGLPVAAEAFWFDMPCALVSALLCIPIFVTGWVISRREGWIMLGLYGGYLVMLLWAQSR